MLDVVLDRDSNIQGFQGVQEGSQRSVAFATDIALNGLSTASDAAIHYRSLQNRIRSIFARHHRNVVKLEPSPTHERRIGLIAQCAACNSAGAPRCLDGKILVLEQTPDILVAHLALRLICVVLNDSVEFNL